MTRLHLVVATVIALLLATAAYQTTVPPEKAPTASEQAAVQTILALRLPDGAGQPHALAQWSGRVLVINYWATWCPPCREEMPAFSRLHEQLAGQGVQFVGLSIDDAAKVAEYQKNTPVSYPLLIAPPETLALTAELGNSAQAMPFTLIVDRKGQLVASRLGRYAEADLAALLKKQL